MMRANLNGRVMRPAQLCRFFDSAALAGGAN